VTEKLQKDMKQRGCGLEALTGICMVVLKNTTTNLMQEPSIFFVETYGHTSVRFAADFLRIILIERYILIFIVFTASGTLIWEFSLSNWTSILRVVTTRSTCPARNRAAKRLRRTQAYWLWKRNAVL
jgi:hypothetical protein